MTETGTERAGPGRWAIVAAVCVAVAACGLVAVTALHSSGARRAAAPRLSPGCTDLDGVGNCHGIDDPPAEIDPGHAASFPVYVHNPGAAFTADAAVTVAVPRGRHGQVGVTAPGGRAVRLRDAGTDARGRDLVRGTFTARVAAGTGYITYTVTTRFGGVPTQRLRSSLVLRRGGNGRDGGGTVYRYGPIDVPYATLHAGFAPRTARLRPGGPPAELTLTVTNKLAVGVRDVVPRLETDCSPDDGTMDSCLPHGRPGTAAFRVEIRRGGRWAPARPYGPAAQSTNTDARMPLPSYDLAPGARHRVRLRVRQVLPAATKHASGTLTAAVVSDVDTASAEAAFPIGSR